MTRLLPLFVFLSLPLGSLIAAGSSDDLQLRSETWGQLDDGRTVRQFIMTAPDGTEARVSDFGAALIGLSVPDRNGALADIVLGFDALAAFAADKSYFGVTVGRYANRIAGAAFELDGIRYAVTANSGKNTLHGGDEGFHKRLWSARELREPGRVGVAFSRLSPDGEEGFPGNLSAQATYWLNNDGSLRIEYRAVTDKPTVCSMTNHAYFNLAGHGSGSAMGQQLRIESDAFTEVDDERIPTGVIRSVAGTSMDFREQVAIGDRLDPKDPLQLASRGFDHNFVLRSAEEDAMALAATVVDPDSGRVMEIWSDMPGLQFYSGNWLSGKGKGGVEYAQRGAYCLEPQAFPDSPNHPAFPSTVLRPGETYSQSMEFRFRAE